MKIAITAPAGKVDPIKLNAGIEFLKSKGHEVITGHTLKAQDFWTAGAATLRANELESFWTDESVDVVWAARGGYGSAQIIRLLDWEKMRPFQKILCGHSDISVLHLAFLKQGLQRSVSGAMPAVEFALESCDALTIDSTFDLILDSDKVNLNVFSHCTVLKGGKLSGRLIPVTLSVLCSLCGTAYLPEFKNSILVIEDVNENAYRIDAYLNQLSLNGILSDISGLVFADFNNCGHEEELNYIYAKYAKLVCGPVMVGLPFGHCQPRLSLPVGKKINIHL